MSRSASSWSRIPPPVTPAAHSPTCCPCSRRSHRRQRARPCAPTLRLALRPRPTALAAMAAAKSAVEPAAQPALPPVVVPAACSPAGRASIKLRPAALALAAARRAGRVPCALRRPYPPGQGRPRTARSTLAPPPAARRHARHTAPPHHRHAAARRSGPALRCPPLVPTTSQARSAGSRPTRFPAVGLLTWLLRRAESQGVSSRCELSGDARAGHWSAMPPPSQRLAAEFQMGPEATRARCSLLPCPIPPTCQSVCIAPTGDVCVLLCSPCRCPASRGAFQCYGEDSQIHRGRARTLRAIRFWGLV